MRLQGKVSGVCASIGIGRVPGDMASLRAAGTGLNGDVAAAEGCIDQVDTKRCRIAGALEDTRGIDIGVAVAGHNRDVVRIDQPGSTCAMRCGHIRGTAHIQPMPRCFDPPAIAAVGAAFGLEGSVGAGDRERVLHIRPENDRAAIPVISCIGLQQGALFDNRNCCRADAVIFPLPATPHQNLAAPGGARCAQVRAGLHQHLFAGGGDAASLAFG